MEGTGRVDMAAPGSARLWRPGRVCSAGSIARRTLDAGPMLTLVEFSVVNYVLTALPKVVSRITRSGASRRDAYALRDSDLTTSTQEFSCGFR